MKSVTLLLLAVTAAAPLVNAASKTPKPAEAPRAEVVFVAPENFTDVRDGYTTTDSGREAILNQVREYISEQSNRFIPTGYKLFVSITDLDLAGDYEPWRGPRWDDVRIVKDIYPPRVQLSFRLTDSTGAVVKEAKRDLRDLAFMMKITAGFRDDPLRHEKELLNDWFRTEFRDLPRTKA